LREAPALRDRLRALYPSTPGRRLKQWLASGRIRVNGAVRRRGDVPVGPDDRIELGRPEAAFPAPLRLVHEDAHVVVVDKPAGLLTIATETERTHTAYRLLRDWQQARGDGRIFIVHRLDRETSGLLVFATTPAVKRALQAQFAARTVTRVYQARVEGIVRAAEGELTDRLAEDRTLRVRIARDRAGREAITRYRVLERHRDTTLLELTLVTGRRGQIRAQLAALGHPIVGDRAYGSTRDPLRRVCLHATRLGFVHPSGTRVSFESSPPPGFSAGKAGWPMIPRNDERARRR
jgi:23S rRNA pseudouridine1911/1915/1917 synthase